MEHKEITREKENLKIGSSQFEREFWKGNIELRVNVDVQQDEQTLKVKSDIDDSDEVEEITATRTPWKKSLCVLYINTHWHWKMGVKKS